MRRAKRPYNFNEAPAKVAFRNSKKEEAWTQNEKERLLQAIHEHGLQNIEQLQLAVPERSMAEIKNYLLTRKNESVWICRNNLSPPLEQWANVLLTKDLNGHLIPDSSREISRFLGFIANTECHPPPEMCNGIDFKELYHFLSQILVGSQPRQVSSSSAVVLREICHFFSKLMQNKDISNHNQFLRKINISEGKVVPIGKSYGKKHTIPLMDVWGNTEVNPLKVFTDMLEIDPSDLLHWNDTCFEASGLKDSDVINLIKGPQQVPVVYKKRRTKTKQPTAGSSQDVSSSQHCDSDIQQELDAIVAEVEASCAQPRSTEQ